MGPRVQLVLDLVQPLGVRLEDPPAELVVEHEVLRAAGDRGRCVLGGVELGRDRGDLFTQRPEALQHLVLGDEVSRQQPHDWFVLDPGEAGGLVHPRDKRFAALVGERVVRARPRPAGLRVRCEQPEPFEALGLGVELALSRVPVDPTRPRHTDEVVRARAAPSDQSQDDIGEGGERFG